MVVETSTTQPGIMDSKIASGDQLVPADLGVSNPPVDLSLGQQQLADGTLDARKVSEQAVVAGGSRDPALATDSEQARDPEIQRNELESAAFTIVKAEAVQAYRRGLKGEITNPAEVALGRLGKYLASPTVSTPHTGEPLLRTVVDGKYKGGVLEKNHPLPRLKQSSEPGQWATAYDQRATDDDIVPSAKGTGVVQLDTFTGKTSDGLYHFLGTDAVGAYGSEIVLSENDFVQAFMLTQTAELQKGLDTDAVQPSASSGLRKQAVRGVITSMVGICGEFVDQYDADNEGGLDLLEDIDESSVKEALKEANVTISKEAGLTLAQSMIDYNKKNLGGLPAEQVATIDRALEKAKAEIAAGVQPSAEQLYQILVLVGEPGLRSQLDATEETIATLKQRLLQSLPDAERDRLSKDLNRSIQERESLKRVLINNKNNEVFHLLEDAQNGKMDPELVGLLNEKIAGIADPKGFFELRPEDLEDKNSLASIIVKHFAIKKGIDTEKVEAWLTKFFKEHGGEIAMMGIFALFQMMTGIVTDAVKKA